MSREPRPPQLHHCADDSFKWIFMTENCYCDRSSTDAILTFSYKHLCFRQVFIFSCGPSSSINGLVCLSVCPSVRPSVRHTIFTMFLSLYHHGNFMNNYLLWKWWASKGQGKKSKVKVTEVKANFVPTWAFSDRKSSLNSEMATKWCTEFEGA